MLTTVERQKMVFEMVKDIKVVFRKEPGSRSVQSDDGRAPMWKKKSIFLGVTLLGSFRRPPRN